MLVGRFCQLFSPVSSFCAYLNKVNLLLAVASYFTDRYKSGINISILTLSKKVNKEFFQNANLLSLLQILRKHIMLLGS